VQVEVWAHILVSVINFINKFACWSHYFYCKQLSCYFAVAFWKKKKTTSEGGSWLVTFINIPLFDELTNNTVLLQIQCFPIYCFISADTRFFSSVCRYTKKNRTYPRLWHANSFNKYWNFTRWKLCFGFRWDVLY
jgi:hypothetical protein